MIVNFFLEEIMNLGIQIGMYRAHYFGEVLGDHEKAKATIHKTLMRCIPLMESSYPGHYSTITRVRLYYAKLLFEENELHQASLLLQDNISDLTIEIQTRMHLSKDSSAETPKLKNAIKILVLTMLMLERYYESLNDVRKARECTMVAKYLSEDNLPARDNFAANVNAYEQTCDRVFSKILEEQREILGVLEAQDIYQLGLEDERFLTEAELKERIKEERGKGDGKGYLFGRVKIADKLNLKPELPERMQYSLLW
jgi:hypothetical protein